MNPFINKSQIQIPGVHTPLSSFPIESLPPLLNQTVLGVHANTQAPIPLIMSSTLATVSLVCQGIINVRRPNYFEGPTSLFIVNVCNSGERKTTVDEMLTESVRAFEAEYSKKHTSLLAIYFAKKQIWDQKSKVLFASIKKKHKKGDSCDLLEDELTSHLLLEPKKPKQIKLIYNDMTPEALKLGLSENGTSAGIFADEGAIFFEGRARAGLPLYNSMWSGSAIKVDRVSSPSISLNNVRLTISLMVQDGVFEKFLIQHGDAARSNGFLSRCFVTYPISTQGTRFIQNQLPLKEPIQQFHKRIAEILEQMLVRSEQGQSKVVIKFSPSAVVRWIEIYNDIESRMVSGGTCEDIKDYAAKMAENLARLAALFQFFEYDEGEISLEILNCAYTVLIWYGEEFKRLFSPKVKLPQEEIDANDLAHWLRNLNGINGHPIIKKNDIRKFCPNAMRSKDRVDNAINFLLQQNKVTFFYGDQCGNPTVLRKTLWVNFSNLHGGLSYFNPHAGRYAGNFSSINY